MIAGALFAVFFTVVLTGPAGKEWRAARAARRDRPLARVEYLPPFACRTEES